MSSKLMSSFQSAAAGHVGQNSSAHVVRSRAAFWTLISLKCIMKSKKWTLPQTSIKPYPYHEDPKIALNKFGLNQEALFTIQPTIPTNRHGKMGIYSNPEEAQNQ